MRIKDLEGLPEGPLKKQLKKQLAGLPEDTPVRVAPEYLETAQEAPQSLSEAYQSAGEVVVRHKYGAVATERDGMRFDSKAEARYYDELKVRQAAGEVLFFLRQVPVDLGSGVTWRCDFLVFLTDGTTEFVEVKGFETEAWRIKRKLVEGKYPFKVKVVK